MIRNQPEANSFKLASKLGNDSKDPKTVVEFLKTKSFAEITQAQYTVLTPEVRIIYFLYISFLFCVQEHKKNYSNASIKCKNLLILNTNVVNL